MKPASAALPPGGGSPPTPATPPRGLARLVVPLAALLCLAPFVSTGAGLLLGLLVALSLGNP